MNNRNSTQKEIEVVMLATDEKAFNIKILLLHKLGGLYLGNRAGERGTKLYNFLAIKNETDKIIPCVLEDVIPQHLYFLSDEEIKEGDWIMRAFDNIILRDNINSDNRKGEKFYKIIATTDTSLKISVENSKKTAFDYISEVKYLPQPSTQFIQKYIEEYNRGSQIKKVLVEYEEIFE